MQSLSVTAASIAAIQEFVFLNDHYQYTKANFSLIFVGQINASRLDYLFLTIIRHFLIMAH